jgi:hypothetical protein
MRPHSSGDYFTPEMEQAERELDGRIEHATRAMRDVEDKTAAMEQKLRNAEPPTAAEVNRIKAYVLGYALTPEWRHVIERINRGQLTWHGIVTAMAGGGRLDPDVSAAFKSLARVPPANLDKLIDIGVFPRPAPPVTPAAPEAPPAPPTPKRRPPRDDDWDDGYEIDWRRG